MYITTSYSLCSICAHSTTSSHEYPFCALTYNHTCLGPLHTRDWEHVTIMLQALSLVEMVEPVPIRFTLRLMDQRNMWMQDGKVYMDSYMAWTRSCMCHFDFFQKPPLGGRPKTKLGDHGTPNAHNRWLILFLSCVRTYMNRISLQ
jgi:hypothetical protein